MNPDIANYGHVSSNRLICGTGRTGKSTHYIVSVCQHRSARKFVFDYGGQFSQRVGIDPARTLVEMNEATRLGICAFEPSVMFPGRTPDAFRFFCDYAFAIGSEIKGRWLFACDEFQQYTDTNRLPVEFSTLLETGAHYQMDFLAVSRSPNLTNTRVRNQLTHCVAFMATDPNAVRWLEGVGFNIADVKALKKFQFIEWHRDNPPEQRFTRGATRRL